jgi:hypothetical protein
MTGRAPSGARALPQLQLRSDPVDDSDDAAETLERPAVRVRRSRSRPWMRSVRLDRPDEPDEIEIEPQDILIETYVEPPQARRSLVESCSSSIPMARSPNASTPMPLPAALPPRLEPSSSLVPVAMSTSVASLSPPPSIDSRHRSRRSAALVVSSLVAALLVGLAVGVVALGPGSFARHRAAVVEPSNGRHHDGRVAEATSSNAAAPTPSAPVVPSSSSSSDSPSPAIAVPVPTVSVETLPSSSVEPNMTLVTFRAAKDHRIFVDGRVVGSGSEPINIRCGKHTIRIGTHGKSKVTNLPCGGELTLD